MTPPEFGRPKNLEAALSRLPESYEKPLLEVDPYERVVFLRLFIENLLEGSKGRKLETQTLHNRTIPVELEAVKLLHNLNSFRRDMATSKTYFWSFLGTDAYPWPVVYPTGENSYYWWQVTDLDPSIEIGGCKLICIEINKEFGGRFHTRFNLESDFDFAFATQQEIQALNTSLSAHNVTPNKHLIT